MKMTIKILLSLLLAAICLSGFWGCNVESNKNKSVKRFPIIHKTDNDSEDVNFYLINLSMRRIDSLTSELNLRFTRRNQLGL